MAMRAPSPCTTPGCGTLTLGGKCDKHRKEVRRFNDAERGTAHERGYTYRWRKYAAAFLRDHPLCECPDCTAGDGRITPAEVVDHRIPHRGDERLFWDPSNHQAMSKPCHDRKTAREDGGFGHAIG